MSEAKEPTPKESKEKAAKEAGLGFFLSSSPHFHATQNVPQIMWTVVLALLPCVLSGVWYFGAGVLVTIVVSVVAALITEELINKLRRRAPTYKDGSAVITGILLALTLPPALSPFFAALGSIFAIGVGKQVFGGLGCNIFNPALLGRAFLQASFPIQMTTWTMPKSVDAVSAATPLGAFKFEKALTPYFDMFIGNVGGCIGETSSLAILLGGAILLIRQAADWRIPVSLLVTVACFGGLFYLADPTQYPTPLFHLLGGGLLFLAFFMATDMVTSPVTIKGAWIFGIGAGVIVVIIRLFGGLPEGAMYAILLMNAFTPLIDRYSRPRFFGEKVA
jgi:electron transport complex protein RnfD